MKEIILSNPILSSYQKLLKIPVSTSYMDKYFQESCLFCTKDFICLIKDSGGVMQGVSR